MILNVSASSYKISYMDSGASSAGSESSDGNDSDHFTVPSRSTQNKPYKRPTNTKRKQQQALQLLQNKSDAQLRGAAQHNEVEKRRRAYLSHCYTALKEAVPGLENSKASNVTVLRGAVDEIKVCLACPPRAPPPRPIFRVCLKRYHSTLPNV